MTHPLSGLRVVELATDIAGPDHSGTVLSAPLIQISAIDAMLLAVYAPISTYAKN